MENTLMDNRLQVRTREDINICRIKELISASLCCIENNIEIKEEWLDEIYDILSRYREV